MGVASYLNRVLINLLDSYEITHKVATITTDNAKNMIKMGKLMTTALSRRPNNTFDFRHHHIPCLAHIVNLVCQAAIEKGFLAPGWVMNENETQVIQFQPIINDRPVNVLLNSLRRTG